MRANRPCDTIGDLSLSESGTHEALTCARAVGTLDELADASDAPPS